MPGPPPQPPTVTPDGCIFCSASVAMTKEHLWPVWLGTMARSRPGGPFRIYRFRGHRELQPFRTARLDLKVGPVCRPCNNEILSPLENEVKPLLTRMLAGTPTQLDDVGALAIAAWIVRMSMLREFLGPQQEERSFFFSSEERRLFITTLDPPVGTWIWLFKYSNPNRGISGGSCPIDLTGLGSPDGQSDVCRVETGYLGQLGFQFLRRRRVDGKPRVLASETRMDAIMSRWAPATRQLLPLTNDAVEWPPEKVITDSVLRMFSERWGGDASTPDDARRSWAENPR